MRVLYLCHRVPFAPNRGDRIRAYHTLRVLKAAGVRVHLIALAHDDDEVAQGAQVASLVTSHEILRINRIRNRLKGALSLTGTVPLTHTLLDSTAAPGAIERAVTAFKPDVVWAFCSGMARFAMHEPLAGLPLVFDLVDVDSAKWADFSKSTRGPLRWIYAREARELGRFEQAAANKAQITLIVTEREATALRALAPDASMRVVGNGVDVDYFRRPSDMPRRRDIVFTGVFDYGPNEQGAVWFAGEVWPLVRAALPDARFVLVGANPTARVRSLASADGSILVTGRVDDVRPFLWDASVSVAPLHVARGTQNKVLEAIAAGLPAVVTPEVAEGLPEALVPAVAVATSASDFASAVLAQLAAPRVVDMAPWSWERQMADLPAILDRALG